MSRILGVLSPRPHFPSPPLLLRAVNVLGGAHTPAGWQAHTQAQAMTSLVWKGGDSPQLARREAQSLVLDGMVYNNQELATEVGPCATDAELILRLVQQRGLDAALASLNGDFAFIMHDEKEGSLTLARDRMGLRPLYYAQTPDFFAAASQPAPLLALGVSAEVNTQFAALYAASHYRVIDNDIHASPFAHIRQLPAGHVLRFARNDLTLRTWWKPSDEEEWTCSEEILRERYRELFLDAVGLRLRRFKQPLFTLSGGMDSSAILAASRHITGRKQQAISTVYQDATYDESGAIQHMLETNVSEWHTVKVGNPDVFALTAEMIAAHNEPVATATWLPHWLLCRRATALGADAVTSGLGGDELFGGEYEHFFFHFADLHTAGQQETLAHEITCWAKLHDHPLYPKNEGVALAGIRKFTAAGGICLPDRQRIERYSAALRPEYFDLAAYTPCMDHPFASYLKNRCWQDIVRETSPCCIRAQDRQGGAHGLAVFMPFFDPRLVDFMFRVPGQCKIRHGGNKYLARQAMRGILPDATCDNIVKTGWNAPAHQWFSGAGHEQLMDMLHSTAFAQRGIYTVPEVLRLAEEHEHIVTQNQCREHHMMFLWQVVNMELWLQWVDKKEWLHD